MPGFAFKGEGVCLNSNGAVLPFYHRMGPTNDKGAYCSGQCGVVAGCAGFRYNPGGWCVLSGAAFTQEGTPGGGGWFFAPGHGGTGPITQVHTGYPGAYCYARDATATTATTTPPGKVPPPCVRVANRCALPPTVAHLPLPPLCAVSLCVSVCEDPSPCLAFVPMAACTTTH